MQLKASKQETDFEAEFAKIDDSSTNIETVLQQLSQAAFKPPAKNDPEETHMLWEVSILAR